MHITVKGGNLGWKLEYFALPAGNAPEVITVDSTDNTIIVVSNITTRELHYKGSKMVTLVL